MATGTRTRSGAPLALLLRAGQVVLESPFPLAATDVVTLLAEGLSATWVAVEGPGIDATSADRVPTAHVLRLPLRSGRAQGHLVVARETAFSVEDEQTCLAVADLVALAAARHRAEQATRVAHEAADLAARRAVAEVENERDALAGDMHDGLLQALITARFAADMAERPLATGAAGIPPVREAVQDLLGQARRTMWHLRRRASDGALLHALAALGDQIADAGPTYELHAGNVPALVDPARAVLAYRLVQAAVFEAVRTGAQAISVQLEIRSGALHIIVRDDGSGYDTSGALRRWLDRLSLVDGEAQLKSDRRGSRLVARVPDVLARETP